MNDKFYFGILNGGKSMRMGQPKSLVKYNGQPLVRVVYEKAIRYSSSVCVLGSSPIASLPNSVTILEDSFGIGPLKAISSAFNFYGGNWFFWAVDLPLITDELIKKMLWLRGTENNSVVPYHGDIKKYESYFAYYSADLLDKVVPLIRAGRNSMQQILRELRFIGNSQLIKNYGDCFKSWNTPDDIVK